MPSNVSHLHLFDLLYLWLSYDCNYSTDFSVGVGKRVVDARLISVLTVG